jgi:transcription-repair coupling factor (superfamily II helicase)
MDRLVCGDVGFGKTEVALRAAFIAAMNGVTGGGGGADHAAGAAAFQDLYRALARLSGRIAQASRLVGAKELARPRRNSLRARPTSWSAPMRCLARRSSSPIWVC